MALFADPRSRERWAFRRSGRLWHANVVGFIASLVDGRVDQAVLGTAILVRPSRGPLIARIALEDVPRPADFEAIAAILIRFIVLQGVGIPTDVKPVLRVLLGSVAPQAIVATGNQKSVQSITVHPAVIADGVAGAGDEDPIAPIRQHAGGTEGIVVGGAPHLHAIACIVLHRPAPQVVEVTIDPDADCTAADRVVADAVVVADDQDAKLASPSGSDALQVVAVRANAPANGATHGIEADNSNFRGAGDVYYGSSSGRDDLRHGTLGNGQALGTVDNHVLGAAPVEPDHLAVMGRVHGVLEGLGRWDAADQRRVVAFRVHSTGEDRVRIFRALCRCR